jgi:hypothetical protein
LGDELIVCIRDRDKIAFAVSKLGFFDVVSHKRVFLNAKIFD